jgi:uncharacterized repeat protein (TIGR01451 family)
MNSVITGQHHLWLLRCRQHFGWLLTAILLPFILLLFTMAAIGGGVVHVAVVSSTAAAAPADSDVLQLQKEAEPVVIYAGETVTYTFTITNSGHISLTVLILTDDHLDLIEHDIAFLEPQESVTLTWPITVVESVTNLATITGTLHGNGEMVSATATAVVEVIDPAIQIGKTVTPTLILAGETVTYTYAVTNSGDVSLTSVTLVDDHLGPIGTPFTLAPSAAVTLAQTAAPRVDVTNLATVTGTHPLGIVSAQATAFVKVNHRVFLPVTLNSYPSWQQVGNKPEAVARFHDVAVCGERYLAGTNAGLYRLQGNQWLRETAVPDDHTVNRLTFAGSACNAAYVTTAGSGLWFGRYDNGWQWQRVDSGSDVTAAVVVLGNTLFVGNSSGVQWSTIPASGSSHNWQSVNLDGLVLGLTRLPGSDTIFAAVWTKGVYANSGGDLSPWIPVGLLPNLLVYEAVGSSAGTPYLAGTLGGLYRWQSGNWAAVPDAVGSPTFAVSATGSRLYAGLQQHGVLVSYDSGESWSTMNQSLHMPAGEEFQVRGFFVSANGDYIYAATTSGVWRWPAP